MAKKEKDMAEEVNNKKRNKLIFDINLERHAQVKLWAKRRGMSLSKYIVMAIDERLDKERWKDEKDS